MLIVTDEQAAFTYYGDADRGRPGELPVYTWNLAGYRVGHAPSGSENRHTFGGLSDAAFRMVPLLERGGTPTGPGSADYESGPSVGRGMGHE